MSVIHSHSIDKNVRYERNPLSSRQPYFKPHPSLQSTHVYQNDRPIYNPNFDLTAAHISSRNLYLILLFLLFLLPPSPSLSLFLYLYVSAHASHCMSAFFAFSSIKSRILQSYVKCGDHRTHIVAILSIRPSICQHAI